jgi:CubicO group peptidase (beta-lactamase class C family)
LDSLSAKHFTGLLCLFKDGKEVFFHSVGKPNPDRVDSFTPAGAIEIGSIVKSFVGIAFQRLAEKKKVNLDDSISKYFRNVPADKKMITLHMLLHHRSGFKDIFGDDYSPMKRDQLMNIMLKSKLEFVPGAKDQYSNAGFSMLATILEKVTGEPIDDYLWRSQFKPLGMTNTGYRRSGRKSEDLPVGTDSDGKPWGTPLDRFWYKDGPSWNLRGNGGMFSTARDLSRWAHGVLETSFVSDDIRLRFIPGLFKPGAPTSKVWTAAGGNGIFDTVMAYNRGRKITIIAFSTDGRFSIEDSLWDMGSLMFKVVDEAK